MATANGGLIRYKTYDGQFRAAVYSSLANAQADAALLNSANSAGMPIVIGVDLTDSNSPYVGVTALIVTPS